MVAEVGRRQTSLVPFHAWQSHTRHPDDVNAKRLSNLYGHSLPRELSCLRTMSNASASLSREKPAAHSSNLSLEESTVSQHQDATRLPRTTTQSASRSKSTGETFTFPRDAPPHAPISLEHSLQGLALGPPKRRRARNDVDGPGTDTLSYKKRRLRYNLITSRLSQPFSLPATHILNREGPEDTPVLSRFLKMAAAGAKKASHQTAIVRKAAILNRIRLRVREDALNRGHVVVAAAVANPGVLNHGYQAVTSSTGSMFPGTGSGSWLRDMPYAFKPHTTNPSSMSPSIVTAPQIQRNPVSRTPPPEPRLSPVKSPRLLPTLPEEIVDERPPLEEEDGEEETSFPASDLYSSYDDSDDDFEDVYADFGVLFGPSSVASDANTPRSQAESRGPQQEEDHFYEEYLDELDGLPWAAV